MIAMLKEWVIPASILIAVVLLLRGLLGKRINAGLRYGLWAVVLMRLLIPVPHITLSMRMPQLPDWTPPEVMQEESIYILPVDIAPLEKAGVHVGENGALGDSNSFGYPRLTDDGERVVRYAGRISPLELLGIIWFAGVVIFGIALLAANWRFFLRLRRVRRPLESTGAPVPVYTASALPSPCLFGLLHPAIYVTEEAAADPSMLRHVLAHELTHYNHRDHLWSVLRGSALAVHWWNPLVWAAVVCSRRDGELACDEGALRFLGEGERKAYGETLLTLVTAKSRPADLFTFATTMTGGKRSLRERIQRIACKPKQHVSALVAVVLVLTISVLAAFSQAEEPTAPEVNRDAPTTRSRTDDAWKNAEITLDEKGVPHIHYAYTIPGTNAATAEVDEFLDGDPIPAPREWADDDTAGRNQAATLAFSPNVWAKLVSPDDGWLVACYGRGVAAADTYVYKTADGGMTWTEVEMPGTSWHISDVGFLSPDRLIVAQRLFDDAPCFITKDGGESWEEIELPDTMVTAIHSETVTMFVGPSESDRETFFMTSDDLGDTWNVQPLPAHLFDEDGSLWDNLSNYKSYAEDHPDDIWSPLSDLLQNLEEEDISGEQGISTAELVILLRDAERGSRFYTWGSYAAAYDGHGAEEYAAAQLDVPLADGSTLYLIASSKNDFSNVLMILETADEAVSAFYEASELNLMLREIEQS